MALLGFTVTYDQSEFAVAKGHVDWGVLVSEWQGSADVYIVGETPEQAAQLLREAADAIDADRAYLAESRGE